MLVNEQQKSRENIGIYVIYTLLFTLFVFKMFFYSDIVTTPDYFAQVSYVVYMEKNPDVIIPDFKEIEMYRCYPTQAEHIYKLEPKGAVCYLGHPPLYYKIMQFVNAVEFVGDEVYVNAYKLSVANIILTSITIIIIFYIGFDFLCKRKASWQIHLLYGAICTSLPLYGFTGSNVNNDNLCNLGIAVLLLGIKYFFENEHLARAYFLISIGFTFSLLGKLTTGLVVIMVCLIVIVYVCVKEKNLSIICNKFFVGTLPIYIISIVYFGIIYYRYGVLQPSYAVIAPEEYYASHFYVEEGSRVVMTLWENMKYFFSGIGETWTATYDSYFMVRRPFLLVIPYVVVLLLFATNAVVCGKECIKANNPIREIVVPAFAIAMLFTLAVHYYQHWTGYLKSGYLGAYQARYYMPSLPAIAYGVCDIGSNLQAKTKGKKVGLLNGVWVILSVLMLYADFFFFLTNYYTVV